MDHHKECEEIHGKEFSEGFYANFLEAKLEYTEEKLQEAEAHNKRLMKRVKENGHTPFCSQFMADGKYEVDCVCGLDKLLNSAGKPTGGNGKG